MYTNSNVQDYKINGPNGNHLYIIGQSDAMQEVYQKIRLLSGKPSAVLITGETGTGKELVAKAMHYSNPSLNGSSNFVAVQPELPKELLYAELFGYERGAFTGASQSRVGYFESANNGTLFLDEVSDIPNDVQVMLLRVLQEREIVRLGTSSPRKVNFRLICATNKDLEDMIGKGKFREDLFYRINVCTVYIHPLRERKEDIELLVHHFIGKYNAILGTSVEDIERDALEKLKQHHWPGNVRELENLVHRTLAYMEKGTIKASNISLGNQLVVQNGKIDTEGVDSDLKLFEYLSRPEIFRHYLILRLQELGENINSFANSTGIYRTNLYHYANGHSNPNANHFIRIIRALGVGETTLQKLKEFKKSHEKLRIRKSM